MPDVFANSRSILQSGDGLTHTAAPPDVCKTPSPAGPVPIPYPNMAMDSDLASGTKKVKIDGNPVATEASNLSTSSGDEPGTAGGGVVSSKFKGKLTWGSGSSDVIAEGNGVARFMDVTQHNGNTFNTAFMAMGAANTGVAYGDDFTGQCEICHAGPVKHRILETKATVKICKDIIAAVLQHFRTLTSTPGTSKGQIKKYANENNLYDADGVKIGKTWRGYMVGVMICKCGQSFAAMSGNTLSGFEGDAKPHVTKVIPGGSVGAANLAEANMSALATAAKKATCIRNAWDAASSANDEGKEGYNPPGACAAMKLLSKSGHAPLEMTEMFFDPNVGGANAWSAAYDWRITDAAGRWAKLSALQQKSVLQNKQSNRSTRPFAADQTVASCHTCQMILYMTNCPERTC